MSADNYYIIRKLDNGRFVALMGFASDEEERVYDPQRDGALQSFKTLQEAIRFTDDEPAEYGARIHPECFESRPTLEPPEEEETPDLTEALRQVLNAYSAENNSGTPDYILADYLMTCLEAFDTALVQRANWRGESVELPALQRMTPSDVVNQYDYPTSDPEEKSLDDILEWRMERHASPSKSGYNPEPIEHSTIFSKTDDEHERRGEAGL